MRYRIEEDKPRFSWWRDVAEMLLLIVVVSFMTVMFVDAMSREKLGDCTVCLWERVK